MAQLVVGTLKEGRNESHKRFLTGLCHSGGHGDAILFGDTDIHEAFAGCLTTFRTESDRSWRAGIQHGDILVGRHKVEHVAGKNIIVALTGLMDRSARGRIERTCEMESLLIAFRHGETLPFHRVEMDHNGTVGVFHFTESLNQMTQVVALLHINIFIAKSLKNIVGGFAV